MNLQNFLAFLIFMIAMFYTQADYILSANNKNTVSKYWKTCANSWKYIYGNYEICSDKASKPCILQTDYYPIKDRIYRIFIDIKTTYPKLCKTETYCDTFLDIHYYFGKVTDSPSFKLLETINAKSEKRYPRVLSSKLSLDLEDQYSGLYIAISHRNGTCASITNLKLTFHKCSIFSTKNLAIFSSKNAPSSRNKEIINGKCVQNAEEINGNEDILQTCYSNGSYVFKGRCICNKGYERKENTCSKCLTGKFKASNENTECKSCGSNTVQSENNRLTCPCKDGYFRLPSEKQNDHANCYTAGLIKNFKYSNYTDGSVTITWSPSFNHPNNPEVYIVAINDTTTKTKKRQLKFESNEFTTTVDIKVTTEVNIEGRNYCGPTHEERVYVHENRYLSAGNSLNSNKSLLTSIIMVFRCLYMETFI